MTSDNSTNTRKTYDGEQVRAAFAHEHKFWSARRTGRMYRHRDKKRPRWDGGVYKGKTYPSVWPELARKFNKCKFNPRLYLRIVFDLFDPCPATPIAIFSKEVIEGGMEVMKKVKEEKMFLQLYRQYYREALILCDDDINDSGVFEFILHDFQSCALFRYCAAIEARAMDVAEEERFSAVTEFIVAPAVYTAAWGKCLPSDFDYTVIETIEKYHRRTGMLL